MTEPLAQIEESSNLRLLRRLVTILLVVMILGFVILIGLFASRFGALEQIAPASAPQDIAPQALDLPAQIDLPDGTKAEALTLGDDWYAIVTDDDRILIYNRADNSLRQTVTIRP